MAQNDSPETPHPPSEASLSVERLETLEARDIPDLCDATEAAITNGGGFGWVDLPARDSLERFWHGVIAMPTRDLFVGRVDGVIAGTAQLIRQPTNNQAQSFGGQVTTFFVSPWARKRGLGAMMLAKIEKYALEIGLDILNLDVRITQPDGIRLFQRAGFEKWGENPLYAKVKDEVIAGVYYHKNLRQES